MMKFLLQKSGTWGKWKSLAGPSLLLRRQRVQKERTSSTINASLGGCLMILGLKKRKNRQKMEASVLNHFYNLKLLKKEKHP